MRVLWLAVAVVLLDQASKAVVLQFMRRHESIPVLGDWLRLTFTENPGMAFGITLGPPGTVSVLSIVATILVGAYIYRYVHQVPREYAPYRWSLGLILGGAVGNIIDRIFYGVLLDYGPLFTGRVVDFVHVSLWDGFIPNGVPMIGGSYLELFPIWNVADMSIVIGVVGVLFFHRSFHEQRRARAEDGVRGGEAEPVEDKEAPFVESNGTRDGEGDEESPPPSDSSVLSSPEQAESSTSGRSSSGSFTSGNGTDS